jgi:outer membrane protein assembly factor BamB
MGIYGVGGAGRYLLLAGDGGRRHAFDFSSYWTAPVPGGQAWPQDLLWARVVDERLYVSHAHLTYAESTGGLTGYLTALRVADGALLWRSRPRVANARTFEVVDDAIIVGYGFTAESDYLYVLDRFTGHVVQEERIRTAPTWIVMRGGILLVRAYDADYEFAVR